MATAHVNTDDLRQLQSQVKKTEDEIKQAISRLKSKLNSTDWKDSARRDFEGKLNDASSSINQANRRLSELSPILSKKISEAERYLGR